MAGRRSIFAALATAALAVSGAFAQDAATMTPATRPTTTIAPMATIAPATRPDFLGEIEKFEADDAVRMLSTGGVVFYGSSTIRLWETGESFPELPTINRGFGGSQMHQALMYDDRVVFKYQPKVVVLYEGDNDLQSGKEPARIGGEITQFAGDLHTKLPAARLVMISVKPSPSRWRLQPKMTEVNVIQKAYADANASWVTYLDTVPLMLGENGEPRPELYRPDRLHMTDAGYARWNDALRPVLDKLMKD